MESDEKIKNKVVKTYAEDMANAIEESGGGLIKKIIHEQEEKEAQNKTLSPESRKNQAYLIAGSALLLMALAGVAFLLSVKEDISSVPIGAQFTPIIFADKTQFKEIDGLDKDGIMKAIANEIRILDVKAKGVGVFYLTTSKKIVGFKGFLRLIKSDAALEPTDFIDDHFLLGVVNGREEPALPEGKDFFILLKVRSFADAFPFMLAWEKTILSDLYGPLGVSLSSETSYLLTENFEDGVVENKNARILYDKNREIVVMYVFADEKSVVLTGTERAARELMLRLVQSRVKK